MRAIPPSCATVCNRQGAEAFAQEAYVKASNTGSLENFGSSVAISGDTLAVGAPGEDSNATGIDGDQGNDDASFSGAVYVFTRSGGTWSQEASIKASNTTPWDLFGYSVALSGDTLAVGAYEESSRATGMNGNQSQAGGNYCIKSGAAYVFR